MLLYLGIFLGLLSMISYGVMDFIMAHVSRKIGALRTSFWIMLITLLGFIAASVFLYQQHTYTSYDIILIILTGLVSVIGLVSFNKGLEAGNISIVTTIASGWGVISVVLSYIFLDEHIGYLQIFYIGIIILGTILASLEINNVLHKPKRSAGIAYAFITVMGWGVFFFLTALLIEKFGWFDGSMLTLPFTVLGIFIVSRFLKVKLHQTKHALPILLLISALNIIGYVAYSIAVSYSYADIVAPIVAAAPIITIMLALIRLKEKISLNQKIGIGITLIGIILLSV